MRNSPYLSAPGAYERTGLHRAARPVLVASILWSLAALPCAGDRVEPPHTADAPTRIVEVPRAALPPLLLQQAHRILMPLDAYLELRRRATAEQEAGPPETALLRELDLALELHEDRVVIVAEGSVEGLRDGLHACVIGTGGILWTDVLIDGEPAELGGEIGGPLTVFFKGKGTRSLQLRGVAGLVRHDHLQQLNLTLPDRPVRLRLIAPGDIDIAAGTPAESRTYDADTDQTTFVLHPLNRQLSVSFRVNRLLRTMQASLRAQLSLVSTLGPAEEGVALSMQVTALNQPVTALRLDVPRDVSVFDVHGTHVSGWRLEEGEGDPAVLHIELREEVLGPFTVELRGIRRGVDLDNWSPTRLHLRDADLQQTLYALILEGDLRIRDLETSEARAIDPRHVRQLLPLTDAGPPPLAAWYAPDGATALRARFVRPEVRLSGVANLMLSLSEQDTRLDGGVVLLSSGAALREGWFLLPRSWEIQTVTSDAGAGTSFEVFDAPGDMRRVRVRFPREWPADSPVTFRFTARSIPTGWLDANGEHRVVFPRFELYGVDTFSGAIGVEALDELVLRVVEVEGLTPLDQNEKTQFGLRSTEHDQAWRFEEPGYALVVETERRRPEIQAEAYAFFRVERDRVHARYEMLYTVRRARAREVSFTLPVRLPVTVTVRGEKGTQVEQVDRQPDGEGEIWTVQLAAGGPMDVHLGLDTDFPLEPGVLFPLPLPRAVGVDIQSGYVSVEGSPELETALVGAPREVDVGELAEAVYQPGPRMLGTHVYLADPPEIALSTSRLPLVDVPSALVRRMHLTSQLAVGGSVQTEAVFSVERAPPFLSVWLPPGAQCWAVQVDGVSVQPHTGSDGRMLIPLQQGVEALGTRDVRLVYETRVPPLGVRSRLQIEAPKLALHNSESEAPVLVTLETRWQLAPPGGFQLADSFGPAAPVILARPEPAALQLGVWLYRIGGGHGLMGCQRSMATSVKMRGYAEDMSGVAMEQGWGSDEHETSDLNARPRPESVPSPPSREVLVDEDQDGEWGNERRDTSQREGAATQPPADKLPVAPTGFRSLPIRLAADHRAIGFHHVGDEAALDVTLVRTDRFRSLAWAVALGVLAGGLVFLRRPARYRVRYVAGMLLLSTLLSAPPALFAFVPVFNAAFYTALVLVPVYLLAAMCLRVVRAVFPVLLLGLCLALPGPARAEQEPAPLPLPIPDDVLVVPTGENRVLVPMAHMETLWERLRRMEQPERPPEPDFTWMGAGTSVVLGGGDSLAVSTTLRFRVRGDGPRAIPLALQDAVLAGGALNGGPVRWRQDARGPAVLVDGPGDYTLRLDLQVAVTERGEGRVARALLPALPGHRLAVTVPEADTELTLRTETVPRVVRTAAAGEEVESFIGAAGLFELVWRPATASSPGESTVQVESLALFEARDDIVALAWSLRATVRGDALESVDLTAPGGWHLGEVTGGNVRGWEPLEGEDGAQRFRLHLLRPATDQVEAVLHFWRRPAGEPDAMKWREEVPAIGVVGAQRHTGQILLRRPSHLGMRVEVTEGLRREETVPERFDALSQGLPVGVYRGEPFQSFTFHTPEYRMTVEMERAAPRMEAGWERIFRIAQREQIVEARCRIRIEDQAVYRMDFLMPAGMEILSVQAEGEPLWHVEPEADGNRLSLFSGSGWRGAVDVVISGRYQRELGEGPVALPDMRLLGTHRQQGQWVIQADPFYTVEAEGLEHAETVPVSRTHGWLTGPQRPTARLAIAFTREDHQGRIRLLRRPVAITCTTFTNLRITDRVIEETVLLDYRISGSGAREFVFRLPAHLADARLRVPLLRRSTATPLADDPEWVEMRIELQDEVMGQLLILVEHDRILNAGPISAWTPQALTGRLDRHYLTLENAGRDEVTVIGSEGLDPLTRQHADWSAAVARLTGSAAYAFVARAQAAPAMLRFQTTERQHVRTAGARIGLARVVLVMDESGAYRAQWTGHIDNRTEQFLAMELPEGARLLHVTVAGDPVKPVSDPGAGERHVRIPLVKTAAGELDVPVELVYGGRIDGFGALRGSGFPFPQAVNVPVELSQAELHLPRHRNWLRFDGTMRQVDDELDFRAGLLQYQTDMAERLAQTLLTGGDYERARAKVYLGELSSQIDQAASVPLTKGGGGRGELGRQADIARNVVSEAESKSMTLDSARDANIRDNRAAFNADFDEQRNEWGFNQVLLNPGNFAPGAQERGAIQDEQFQQQQVDYNVLRGQAAHIGRGESSRRERGAQVAEPVVSRGQASQAMRYVERLGEERAEYEQATEGEDPAAAALMPIPDPALTQVYRFTTPRGDMRVTAVSLSGRARRGWERLGGALVVLLLAGLVVRGKPIHTYASLWLALGLISLLGGFLPVFGFLLVLYAVICLIVKRIRSRKAHPAR